MSHDKVGSAADKKMNVVRHHNISAHGNVELVLSSLGEADKRDVNLIACEPSRSAMGAECNEEEWARAEKSIKAQGPVGEVLLHIGILIPGTSRGRVPDRAL